MMTKTDFAFLRFNFRLFFDEFNLLSEELHYQLT